MKDIFSIARKVLVWLGEEDEYTSFGFRYAQRLYDALGDEYVNLNYEGKYDLFCDIFDQVPQQYIDHHVKCYGPYLDSSEAFENFVEGVLIWCLATTHRISYRDWFERTWTFQEIMLARDADLICGGWIKSTCCTKGANEEMPIAKYLLAMVE
jgi:hypothetical protein